MKILLVVSSLTGNTKTFIDFIKRNTSKEVIICDDFSINPDNYDSVILGTYSWGGDGRVPRKLKKYIQENSESLKRKNLFIYGSGNSIYPNFCGAVDRLTRYFLKYDTKVIGNFKFEQRFDESEFDESELKELKNKLQSL